MNIIQFILIILCILIFIPWFSFTIAAFLTNNCLFPQNFIVARKLRRVLNNKIDLNKWYIKEVSGFTAEKIKGNIWKIYAEVHNRHTHDWTCGFLFFNSKDETIINDFNNFGLLKK